MKNSNTEKMKQEEKAKQKHKKTTKQDKKKLKKTTQTETRKQENKNTETQKKKRQREKTITKIKRGRTKNGNMDNKKTGNRENGRENVKTRGPTLFPHQVKISKQHPARFPDQSDTKTRACIFSCTFPQQSTSQDPDLREVLKLSGCGTHVLFGRSV